jgi:hypothetical protein
MKKEIFFAHPHTLFKKVEDVLNRIGPKKFFSSPEEEVKKAREGFAAYFFTLALKKYTGRDWWLSQPDQSDRSYPDFDFISFSNTPQETKIEPVELTGVYPHFKDFEEMAEVIKKKQNQYGNKPVRFSLLVFVNHVKSEEWISLLRERLETEYPFLSVWTIHLRFKKGGKDVGKAVAQRIRPFPGLRIEADTSDPEVHKIQTIPNFIEESREGGNVNLRFKPGSFNF